MSRLLLIISFLFINNLFLVWSVAQTTENVLLCPSFEKVQHGTVHIQMINSKQIASIKCDEGYDIDGNPNVYCIDGQWEQFSLTPCIRRCPHPPYVENGGLEIEGQKDQIGYFQKGAVATYSCAKGYYLSPIESQYRVCEKGIWTGPVASCIHLKKMTKMSFCSNPENVLNGYFVHEKTNHFEENTNFIGQKLLYSCKPGYILDGPSEQECLDGGVWSPRNSPKCIPLKSESPEYLHLPCSVIHTLPYTDMTFISGYQTDENAIPGTVIEMRCSDNYRDRKNPCEPSKLQCVNGRWIGTFPKCEPALDCYAPPPVPFATVIKTNFPEGNSSSPASFPIRSQISYECLPGYSIEGNNEMICSPGGCWLPNIPPFCLRDGDNYYLEVNSVNAILISAAAGAGVLGLLMVVCVVVLCRRKKPISRSVPISPPTQRHDMGDHASLIHPDRLALIAFADEMQNGSQGSLPTYDEAVRERVPGLTVNRFHRPHWPNLAGRRTRGSPNPDYVARQGSFASHTPSTRSAGDSMGSTDTVAVSEGSTNVTLDTASSHSGSQAASCRVHCGSIASFDTCSVINTEGVPLLEESELEEIQGGDNLSAVLDNCNVSDTGSFKLSTASADAP